MKYPDDFNLKPECKAISPEEINGLLKLALTESPDGSVWQGDTMVTVTDKDYVQVWKLVAEHEPEDEIAPGGENKNGVNTKAELR